MHLQVNGRYLVQRVTGVQRYAREVVARHASQCELICPALSLKGSMGHTWEQMVLPWRMKRGLLWSPCSTGPLAVRDQVVTIHDCAFHDAPTGFARSFAAWLAYLVPRLARRVRQIITVSHFSAERVSELCGIPRERIAVIYNGVDERFFQSNTALCDNVRQRLRLPAQYVLCVGSLEPRKNLPRLLAAWEQLGSVKNGLKLVLVGATSRVFRSPLLPPLGGDVMLAGYIAEADLPAVYAAAEAFVYPSLYEGFGLPVLEAMASGTPVVCSNTTSLPEVAGPAAVGVDPLDEAAIAAGIEQVLSDAALRRELSEAGRMRARDFTWDRTATQTWQVLQRAATEGLAV